MTGDSTERRARAMLSLLADAGDPVLGAALQSRTAAEMLAAITGTDDIRGLDLADRPEEQPLGRALARWRRRIPLLPSVARLAAWQDSGLRLVCPGEPEWPTQLDDLGDARPLELWVRGNADLRYTCLRSVSVVGARTATGYCATVSVQLAAALAERGTTIVSGGPMGTISQAACITRVDPQRT
jgi:DNA processing protein